jgi:hypothetical protein
MILHSFIISRIRELEIIEWNHAVLADCFSQKPRWGKANGFKFSLTHDKAILS